jgi:hypothetical protein
MPGWWNMPHPKKFIYYLFHPDNALQDFSPVQVFHPDINQSEIINNGSIF